jgi:osmotically-inducible protein OsmY
MTDSTAAIVAALRRELGADLQDDTDVIMDDDEVIHLRGSVRRISAKRRALRIAAQAAGTQRIRNELRLRGGDEDIQPQSDERLAALLDEALRADSAFQGMPLAQHARPQPDADGNWLSVEAIEGVLRLDGQVPSLSHRRLAEVMAWWIPGVLDVVNHLRVQPAERDDDGEIADVIRLVFDKDTALDAGSINPQVEDAVVVLRGYVSTAEQAERAERNCWFIPGVREVRNELSMP